MTPVSFAPPRTHGSASPFPHLVFLLLLCGWLFFLNLGRVPFLGKDEPKNAEAVREMMVRGDWITTTLRGEPWFDKPILYYWVALVFFHLLGPGEAAARTASALFGTGGVLLTWWFARILFDARVALRAAIILATALEYFWFSRTAVVDLSLTFCVTLCLVAFHRALEGERPSSTWFRVGFAALGAATLAKGPVGIVLPGLVLGSYLLAGRRFQNLRRIPWGSGVLWFLMVAAPWYVAVSLRHGLKFWNDFVVNRNIDRYLSTVHHHPGPVYYYLPVLVIGLFPWGALVPFAVGRVFRQGWRVLLGDRRREAFLFLWILMPLLFFSFAGSKLPSYLLPCFPALSILIAESWDTLMGGAVRGGGRTSPNPWALGFLLVLFPVLAEGIRRWCQIEAPEQLPSQWPLALALLGTGLGLVAVCLMRRYRLLFAVCAAGTVLSLTALVVFSLGNVRETASLTRIARDSVRLSREGATVVAYRNFHNGLFYYTEDRIPWVKRRADLDRLLVQKGTVFCLLEEDGLGELVSDTTLVVDVVGREYKVTLARVSRRQKDGTG